MGTTDISLRYLLFGEDRSAGKTMKGVAGEAQKTGHHFRNSVIGGATAASAAIVAFGKVSVDKFKEVGGETLGLMRVMGGTAQSASQLRFAASQSGVTYETLAKSTGKFSKALVAAEASSKSTSKMIKTLGFDFRDAHGHVLPMADLLPKVADRFKDMPGGAEKTALAMQLFGKAGTDMLPFLNKGSDGIAALAKESDKFGLTLTGKNLDALKQSKASQREWNASLDGLRVQFGAQVLPMLNLFIGYLRDHVIPMVVKVTTFFREHQSTAKALAAVIGGVMVIALSAYAVSMASAAVATIAATWPILAIIAAVALLAAGVYLLWTKWDQIWGWISHHKAIAVVIALVLAVVAPFLLIGVALVALAKNWDKVWGGMRDAFRTVVLTIIDLFGSIIHGAASAFGWVPGIGGKLKQASKDFDKFRDSVNKSLGGIKDQKVSLTVETRTIATNLARSGQTGAANATRAGFATGGRPPLGIASWVGERGRELFVPDQPGTIIPNHIAEAVAQQPAQQSEPFVVQLFIDGREVRATQKRTTRFLGGVT